MMFYLGIDVAKAKLDCCLLLGEKQDKRKTKVVPNSREGASALIAWLGKQGVATANVHAILEATGPYHEQAALALTEAMLTVSVVNPTQVRHFADSLAVRTKNDVMDSYVLARFGLLMAPMVWVPPAPEVRLLQALNTRREAIKLDIQREENRQEKALAIGDPVLIHRSIEATIDFLKQQLKALSEEIDDHIDRHPDLKRDMALLQTIPGIGPVVGGHMLTLMHAKTFDSADQLTAYLGLVPVERQSGSSVHGKNRLSKAGPARIRSALYMGAVSAIRVNAQVKALYERLRAQGKSKKAAVCAGMRKLAQLCFGVLKSAKPYQNDYLCA